jgi:conjugative transposon TraK protein
MYVIAGEKAVMAFASGRKENISVEARDHVKTFHRLFFTLDPDEKLIEANIRQALYLADETAKRQYDDLKEKGFYEGIVSGNISQELAVDSIKVSTASEPYVFRFYGTLRIVRPTSVITRSLVTGGRLRNISRSDNNPHGLLVERWEVLDNTDKQIETRE